MDIQVKVKRPQGFEGKARQSWSITGFDIALVIIIPSIILLANLVHFFYLKDRLSLYIQEDAITLILIISSVAIAIISSGAAISFRFLSWLYEKIKDLYIINGVIQEDISTIKNLIESLESRHNIIQPGSNFGRILALRNFEYVDLIDGDDHYKTIFGKEAKYYISSTIILDRAEELLTSEVYMNYFIDLKLPPNGHFRLIIARKPNSFDGISAYLRISDTLGYKTSVLPLDMWKKIVVPEISAGISSSEIGSEVIDMFLRNSEIGVLNKDLGSVEDILSDNKEPFAGRIEKREDEKVDGKYTISKFRSSNIESEIGISKNSVEFYIKIMSALHNWKLATECTQKDVQKIFNGTYEDELREAIRAVFR